MKAWILADYQRKQRNRREGEGRGDNILRKMTSKRKSNRGNVKTKTEGREKMQKISRRSDTEGREKERA